MRCRPLTRSALPRLALALGAVFSLSAPSSHAGETPKKGKVDVTWLGHAAFELVSPAGTRVLIDPFLKSNPKTPKARKDVASYKPDLILVTHAHPDHLGDTLDIATRTGAKVVGTYDLISSLKLKDDQKMGGNVGGTFTHKDVTVHMVPAMHSSAPAGRPVGYIIRFDGNKEVFYHSGDTWIFSDMALIHDIYRPTVLLLNTGGGPFTQEPKIAATAAKKFFKRSKFIVPMHLGTFPILAGADEVKKAFKRDRRLKLLQPGQTITF